MAIVQRSGSPGRRRFSPLLWLSSLGAIGVLALGITGTLSQFTASITNPNNEVETAGPSAFGFSESLVVGGVPQSPACATASAGDAVNCDTINKNGEIGQPATPLAPGQSRATTVRLLNTAVATGLSGDLSLSVEPCIQNPPVGVANRRALLVAAADLCAALQITLACAGDGVEFSVGPVSLTAFATTSPYAVVPAIPPGGYVDCAFTTTLPASASAPGLQGILTSQPMTWTFTQSI